MGIRTLYLAPVVILALSSAFMSRVDAAENIDEKAAAIAYQAMIASSAGWADSANKRYFKIAADLYDMAAGICGKDEKSRGKADLYRGLAGINRVYIQTSSTSLRNKYPMIPVIAGACPFRSRSHDVAPAAVKAITGKVIDMLQIQLSLNDTGGGSNSIIVMASNGVESSAIAHARLAFETNSNFNMYAPEEVEELHAIAGDPRAIVQHPTLIIPALESLGLQTTLLVTYERTGAVGSLEMYTAGVYMFSIDKPGETRKLFEVNGFGSVVAPYFISIKKAFAAIMAAAIVIIIFISILLFKIYEQKNVKYVAVCVTVVVACSVFGVGLGAGIDAVARQLADRLTGPAGLLPFLLLAGSFAGILVSLLVLLFLFNILPGLIIVSGSKTFLPVALTSFFAGTSAWLFTNIIRYGMYYPGSISNTDFAVLLFSCLPAGFLVGLCILSLYERKSLKPLSWKKGILGISYAWITGILGIMAGSSIITVCIERYFAVDPAYGKALLAISAGLCLVFIPLVRMKGREIGRASDINKSNRVPHTLDDLMRTLERPEYADPILLSVDEPISMEIARQELSEFFTSCADEKIEEKTIYEGRIYYIHGARGVGKTRFINELLSNTAFDGMKRIYISMDNSQNNGNPFAPFVDGLRDFNDVQAILEAKKLNNIIRGTGGRLQEPAGSIPIIGPVISFLLQVDTSSFLSPIENEDIIKNIADSMLELSRDLIEKEKRGNGTSNLVFVMDDYQHINTECNTLIRKIQDVLKASKEINPVAFILVARDDENAARTAEMLTRLDTSGMVDRKLCGLDMGGMLEVFTNSLNFSPASLKTFYAIWNMATDSRSDHQYIAPEFFLEIMKKIVVTKGAQIRKDANGFGILIEHIAIPEESKKPYTELLEKLTFDEIMVLECAAVVGYEFTIDELRACLPDMPENLLLWRCASIEKKTGYIIDGGGKFRFTDPLATEVLRDGFFTEKDNQLKQVYKKYNELLADYYMGRIEKYEKSGIHADEDLVINAATHRFLSGTRVDRDFSIEASAICARRSDIGRAIDYFNQSRAMEVTLDGRTDPSYIMSFASILQIDREEALSNYEVVRTFSKRLLDAVSFTDNSLMKNDDSVVSIYEVSWLLKGPDDYEKKDENQRKWCKINAEITSSRMNEIIKRDDITGAEALFWLALNDRTPSEQLLNECEKLLGTLPAGHRKSRLLGKIYDSQARALIVNDPTMALEYFNKSIECKKQTGDILGQAISTWGKISLAFNDISANNEIQLLVSEYLIFQEKIGSIKGLFQAHALLGEIYFRKGDMNKAFRHTRNSMNYIMDRHKSIIVLGRMIVIAMILIEKEKINNHKIIITEILLKLVKQYEIKDGLTDAIISMLVETTDLARITQGDYVTGKFVLPEYINSYKSLVMAGACGNVCDLKKFIDTAINITR